MAKKAIPRPHTHQDQPQHYEHRVEVVLEALNHALLGSQTLARFLLAQGEPGWPHYQLLELSTQDFKQAQRWLKKARTAGKRATLRQRMQD